MPVLSLNFFNRGDNESPSSSNGIAVLKKTESRSSSYHLPAKEPPSPVVRDTTPTATPSRTRAGTAESRPVSQMYSYTPPLLGSGAAGDIEELLPVFSYLSSHGNKLYQEGYFLKLNDLDTSGKPNADRNWTECFAQLVGIVLSLWDAAALDAAGQDGEVPPTFINLADASIKMVLSETRRLAGTLLTELDRNPPHSKPRSAASPERPFHFDSRQKPLSPPLQLATFFNAMDRWNTSINV